MKLTAEQARSRFADARVARLATVSAAQKPHLVPFTFAITGDLIVHAVDHKPKSSRDLKRLRNIAENGRVCALVDDYSDDWSRLWWVRADGIAEVWPDAGQDVLALLAEKYRQYREQVPAGPFVAIRVDRWAGWSA